MHDHLASLSQREPALAAASWMRFRLPANAVRRY
jgi:hypothetical protein